MSKAFEALLDNAYQGSMLHESNTEKEDVFSEPREMDFLFYAPDKKVN